MVYWGRSGMGGEVEILHNRMVDQLLRQGFLRSPRLEEAFRAVPRHLFLPGVPLEVVYSGQAIPTHFGPEGLATSSSSEPAIMAEMIDQLQLQPGDRVLEIGTGTGYNAAILAYLAGPEGDVTTIDIDADVVEEARGNLERAGFPHVRTVLGDGWIGVPEAAPYDRIVVTVGVWDLSPYWVEQLRTGGVLVAPLWLGAGVQASIAFCKGEARLRSLSVVPCGFMRMRGPHAGPEGYVLIDGWNACMDEIRVERIDLLKRLLSTEPRREPAPDLPPGWFIRLALQEPEAIALHREGEWLHAMRGIFQASQESLALVESLGRSVRGMLAFGGESAMQRLKETLSHLKPLDLRSLEVEAVPSACSEEGGDRLVLQRRSFRFLLGEKQLGLDRGGGVW